MAVRKGGTESSKDGLRMVRSDLLDSWDDVWTEFAQVDNLLPLSAYLSPAVVSNEEGLLVYGFAALSLPLHCRMHWALGEAL